MRVFHYAKRRAAEPPHPSPGGSFLNVPKIEGFVFDIDTFAVHDGPGIRMAVYLKGCPLSCKWCHSPESQRFEREMIFVRDRCTFCGRCAKICQRSVHRVEHNQHVVLYEKCFACGRCVEHCPSGALALKGYSVFADEIVRKAVRLKPFFNHSGGGITLTGGEVLMQPDFAEAVLTGCRERQIHTAIETSGMCDWSQLRRLLHSTDLILYDIKLIDEAEHRRWTGASNRLIVGNARRLVRYNVRIRTPLIPGITDTTENISGIVAFMRDAGLKSLELLPYNPSSAAKYEWLGRRYEIAAEPQDHARLTELLQIAQAVRLDAIIV